MTGESLTQAFLPWVLAAVMLAMGLSLEIKSFGRVALHPMRLALGLALQMLALPLLAWVIVLLLPLPPLAAAGLLLVSLVPGGATSNMFTYLARGNLALSVTLTALTAFIVPFTLPLIMTWNFALLGLPGTEFSLPYWVVVGQLILVTLVPATAGMIIRCLLGRTIADRLSPIIRRLTGAAMVAMVLALFLVHADSLPSPASMQSVAVLSLCSLAMLIAGSIARGFGMPVTSERSITVEVGVQNAGVAMMVAFTILGNPELGIVPLFYGLMMNVPVFAWVLLQLRQTRPRPGEWIAGET